MFAASDLYYVPVNVLAADPNSASIIGNYPNDAFIPGDGFSGGKAILQWNLATNATQTWSTSGQMYAAARMPWQNSFAYETCCSDHHALVLNTQTCGDYEAYGVSWSAPNGPFTISSGHFFNLGASLASQYATPEHSHAAEAADMPMIAGALISDRDCCGMVISHALEWYGPTGFGNCVKCTAAHGYVRPADSSVGNIPNVCSGSGCAATHMVYGDRIRLHAGFALACTGAGTCPQATAVVNALKTYGALFADGGCCGEGLRWADGADGSNQWNASDLANLSALRMSDFDVVNRAASGGLLCPMGSC